MAFGEPKNVGKAADVFALGLSALAVFGIRDNGLYEGEGDPAKRAKADQFLDDLSKAVDKAKSDPAQRRSALIEGLAKIGVTPDKVQPSALFDLLTQMLDPDPEVRLPIDEVLRHPYFSGLASHSTELPVSVPPGKQEV
jgi:serine/threonine protein kinase